MSPILSAENLSKTSIRCPKKQHSVEGKSEIQPLLRGPFFAQYYRVKFGQSVWKGRDLMFPVFLTSAKIVQSRREEWR